MGKKKTDVQTPPTEGGFDLFRGGYSLIKSTRNFVALPNNPSRFIRFTAQQTGGKRNSFLRMDFGVSLTHAGKAFLAVSVSKW